VKNGETDLAQALGTEKKKKKNKKAPLPTGTIEEKTKSKKQRVMKEQRLARRAMS